MANSKSAKKRAKQAVVRRQRNLDRTSALKTAQKNVLLALKNNDIASAKTLLIEAESKLARAKGKGLLHANTAARRISKLAKKVAQAQQSVA
jgi:small subunit ribosomal protein S20